MLILLVLCENRTQVTILAGSMVREEIYMEVKRFVVEREFEHCRLKCVVVMRDMGHRCGYVGVNKDHPLYGAFYDDETISNLDVHGGITYSSDGSGQYPIESDLWWFGFDCAHYMDLNDHGAALKYFPHLREQILFRKQIDERYKIDGAFVRTIKYIKEQCKILAEQLYLLEQKALVSVGEMEG